MFPDEEDVSVRATEEVDFGLAVQPQVQGDVEPPPTQVIPEIEDSAQPSVVDSLLESTWVPICVAVLVLLLVLLIALLPAIRLAGGKAPEKAEGRSFLDRISDLFVGRLGFLKWFSDRNQAHHAYRNIIVYIQSWEHLGASETAVRVQARNRVRYISHGARKRVIKRLRARKVKSQKEIKELKEQGKDKKAGDREIQLDFYDWSADEIKQTMSNS